MHQIVAKEWGYSACPPIFMQVTGQNLLMEKAVQHLFYWPEKAFDYLQYNIQFIYTIINA